MLSNYVTSAIRTVVPMIVGWLLSLPIATPVLHMLGVDTLEATRTLSALIGFLLAFAYYLAVRAIEQKWPQTGVLLGVPARPVYQQGNTLTAPAGPRTAAKRAPRKARAPQPTYDPRHDGVDDPPL